jgi:hypothetical protein
MIVDESESNEHSQAFRSSKTNLFLFNFKIFNYFFTQEEDASHPKIHFFILNHYPAAPQETVGEATTSLSKTYVFSTDNGNQF